MNDGNIIKQFYDIDDFFGVTEYNLIISIIGPKIMIGSLRDLSLKTFISTESVPIGVNSSICTFLSFTNSYGTLEVSYFFDFAIFNNVEKDQSIVSKMRCLNEDLLKFVATQISILNLRQHRYNEFITFLRYFPDIRDEIIVNSIRAVESNERIGVYDIIGKPSEYFNKLDPEISSRLLPVVLDEEGFFKMYPLCFSLIKHWKSDPEKVANLLRLLIPLTVKAEAIDTENVSVGGIKMSVDKYGDVMDEFYGLLQECYKSMNEEDSLRLKNITKIQKV
ncbi:hypothetical protein GPJ56_002195 [Histomonas meleagridis]|uniref:uncharacterized protein n=1 Tax=Histomonas meleagridis TaxID=135588 RepID=UPI0035593D82|nr:hypothetical protein GPJ56_002195 [Histomonas meleagridis]KAH0806626.1 hypothetical protein GO595_000477 [Histomonas meleagridis]